VLATSFVLGMYAAWLAFSMLTQLPRLGRLARRLDVLRIAPAWQLFRSPPLPVALAWRDQHDDASIGPWQPISIRRPTTALSALWNPGLVEAHLLYTFAAELAGAARADDRAMIETLFAHRALWHHVAHLRATPGTVARQFTVMASFGDDVDEPLETLYTSAFRPISAVGSSPATELTAVRQPASA
jgi:hypothetical protein